MNATPFPEPPVFGSAATSVDALTTPPTTDLHAGAGVSPRWRFADLLRPVAPHADEQTLLACAHAIGGAAHQMAQWWLRTPGVTRAQIVEWYRAASWDGLRGLIDGSAEPA